MSLSSAQTSATIAALFESVDPTPDELDARVDAMISKLGLTRPEPGEGESPSALVYWLLSMSKATYRRALEPLPSPPETEELERRIRERPKATSDLAQMHIDPASVLRRASLVQGHPIVLVGDDDAVSAALKLRGHHDVFVVDLDERLVSFLSRFARTFRCDVFNDAPPPELVETCGTAIIDPIRSFDGCLAFVDFAATCLRRGGRLLWADHPDWNFELPFVLRAAPGFGLELCEVRELWHQYPLTTTWRPQLKAQAEAVGLQRAWLEELADHISGWSHLYIFERF